MNPLIGNDFPHGWFDAMWFVLLLSAFGSLADMVGGAITIIKRFNANQVLLLTGLGAGFLLGATILDRMPASFQELPNSAAVYIILGFLTLLFLGRNHQHHTDQQIDDSHPQRISSRVAMASFLGLLLHTFMDGVVIAGAFAINRATGILMFLAIVLHKIPEGFSMATITLASGKSGAKAFGTSAALAVSTMIGAVVTIEVGHFNVQIVKIFMAFATGSFLYVSASDLIPAVRHHSIWALMAVLAGVGGFYGSLLLVTHVGLS